MSHRASISAIANAAGQRASCGSRTPSAFNTNTSKGSQVIRVTHSQMNRYLWFLIS